MKEKDEHCSRAGQKMTKAKFTFSLKLLLWGFKIQTQRQSRLNQIKWTSLIFFFDVFFASSQSLNRKPKKYKIKKIKK